jgi:hypothetical protein
MTSEPKLAVHDIIGLSWLPGLMLGHVVRQKPGLRLQVP